MYKYLSIYLCKHMFYYESLWKNVQWCTCISEKTNQAAHQGLSSALLFRSTLSRPWQIPCPLSDVHSFSDICSMYKIKKNNKYTNYIDSIYIYHIHKWYIYISYTYENIMFVIKWYILICVYIYIYQWYIYIYKNLSIYISYIHIKSLYISYIHIKSIYCIYHKDIFIYYIHIYIYISYIISNIYQIDID
jgi:hypothetical protein